MDLWESIVLDIVLLSGILLNYIMWNDCHSFSDLKRSLRNNRITCFIWSKNYMGLWKMVQKAKAELATEKCDVGDFFECKKKNLFASSLFENIDKMAPLRVKEKDAQYVRFIYTHLFRDYVLNLEPSHVEIFLKEETIIRLLYMVSLHAPLDAVDNRYLDVLFLLTERLACLIKESGGVRGFGVVVDYYKEKNPEFYNKYLVPCYAKCGVAEPKYLVGKIIK